MRQVTVGLSNSQQLHLGNSVTQLVTKILGITEGEAGAITMEVLARLTPAQTASEIAVAGVMSEEVAAYQRDPAAYEARVQGSVYDIASMRIDSSEEFGRLPPIIEEALRQKVPSGIEHDEEEMMRYSQSIDGYRVADELGVQLDEVLQVSFDRYRRQGEWRGGLLDLRLALFFAGRNRHWGDNWFSGRSPVGKTEREMLADLLEGIKRAWRAEN